MDDIADIAFGGSLAGSPTAPPFLASTAAVEDLVASLPRNLHWDKQKRKERINVGQESESKSMQPLETLAEGDDDGDDDENDRERTGTDTGGASLTTEQSPRSNTGTADDGLTIAWQYRESVQAERQGKSGTTSKSSSGASKSSSIFCHSFDLSGRLNEQGWDRACFCPFSVDIKVDGSTTTASTSAHRTSNGMELYLQVVRKLQTILADKQDRVIRLMLHHVDPSIVSVALTLILTYIRFHELPVVTMVTVKPWTVDRNTAALTSLRRTCDVVLQTEGFASRIQYPPPAEFRHLHGLLLIPKVSTVTAATANGGGHFANLTASKRPPAHVYGLKRDRRKLHVPLLHIPPEDYAGGGGSVGSGAVRSGAGRPKDTIKAATGGCGSAAGSALDF